MTLLIDEGIPSDYSFATHRRMYLDRREKEKQRKAAAERKNRAKIVYEARRKKINELISKHRAFNRNFISFVDMLASKSVKVIEPEILLNCPPPPTPLRLLAGEVCRRHGITVSQLCGPQRNQEFIPARREFCWLAYKDGTRSMPQIGRFLNRDHTTVMASIRKYREQYDLST